MSDYTEFTLLSGLLALAGIVIQPLSSEPAHRISKQAPNVR